MRDFKEIYLDSHLQSITLKVRRNLLICSMVSFMMVKGDLAPTGIPLLGIEIAPEKIEIIPNILNLLVWYYLIKFLVYMHMDGKLYAYRAYKSEYPENREAMSHHKFTKLMRDLSKQLLEKYGLSTFMWISVRSLIDIVFPILIASFSLWVHWAASQISS